MFFVFLLSSIISNSAKSLIVLYNIKYKFCKVVTEICFVY